MNKSRPWQWVPTLYFVEGLPYILITVVSVILYKRMGISNEAIGLYTSWLYLPWVLKPLWSPLIELIGTKRQWFLWMQCLGALSFIGVGLTLPSTAFFTWSIALFWLAAIWSATHDIAADGFYMLALPTDQQAYFIGIRSSFYRLAMVAGQGGLVIIIGLMEDSWEDVPKAWMVGMCMAGGVMLLLTIVNAFVAPRIEEIRQVAAGWKGFAEVFIRFFQKKNIGIGLAFILCYRLGESQLVKMASPFLLDNASEGGLGLTTVQIGGIYGTIGLIALSIGGIVGGYLISRDGLKRWLLPMALALNLPNLLYIYLAATQYAGLELIISVVIVEQFGYGFGFASFLMYTIYLAEGSSKTAHYALATGFMAMGMMFPGMISGYIQAWLGYTGFFIWVAIAGIPGILLLPYLKIPANYGRKS